MVKYSRDDRYDVAHACTHDLRKMEAISALNLGDVVERLTAYDVIGIDEGQFVSYGPRGTVLFPLRSVQ